MVGWVAKRPGTVVIARIHSSLISAAGVESLRWRGYTEGCTPEEERYPVFSARRTRGMAPVVSIRPG